ncbi:iron ABC transporter permease [Alkalihalophilus pseudofirmus]|uniref:Iron ABC transporter permease n=1 Tax=Alkalihalophilus pseudofirmus TaxID=79885 RepID=A0AAJ2TZW0_ALKPS|nr:iron ABC transporter permease [Alkalihalophilus pseudofirmus]MDV2885494.1 iron ABC transporter permease [Alkalihalophilus pseudofirmus]
MGGLQEAGGADPSLKAEEGKKNKHQRGRTRFLVLCLILILIVSITVSIMIGPISISPITVWKIALSKVPYLDTYILQDWTKAQEQIIWEIRFPRIILGAIVGAGLAIVGVAIQALVRNSLADPFILGISSGASVGATLVIVLGAFKMFGLYALSIAAFLGALISVFLVFLVAQVSGKISTVRLLLSGIAISMMLSAVTSYIVISAPREEGVRDALFWMMGSLAGAKWEQLAIPFFSLFIGMVLLLFFARPLNLLLMGEQTAATLGLNINIFKKVLMLVTALLTGVLVAVSGAIGFIGLMVPHVVRLFIGSDHRNVLPISAFVGAIFLIWADVCARTFVAPQELPIGIVTALCGGPFFIWLLRRNSYSFGGGGEK